MRTYICSQPKVTENICLITIRYHYNLIVRMYLTKNRSEYWVTRMRFDVDLYLIL